MPIFTSSKFAFGRVDPPSEPSEGSVALPVAPLTEGYEAGGSIRTRRSSSTYLSRTFTSAGNRNKWTWSGWVKMGGTTNWSHNSEGIFCGVVGGNSNSTHSAFYFYQGQIRFGGWNSPYVYGNNSFIDSSAFYHLVLRFDSSLADGQRAKFYVNGREIARTNQGGSGSLGGELGINQAGVHNIGGNDPQSGNSDMHFANIHFCDGLSYGPEEFGEDTNGFWQPKQFTGSYGTTGFWLNFDDSTQIGKDSSGNGNHWTFNGSINTSISGSNNDRDNGACIPRPVGVTTSNYHNLSTNNTGALGTYCNFQWQSNFNNPGTFSHTGTYFAIGSGSYAFNGSIPVRSGKWYWEAYGDTGVTSGFVGARPGMGSIDNTQSSESTASGRFMFYWHPNGSVYNRLNNTTFATTSAVTYGDGDRIGWNVDLDNNIWYAYKNGTLAASYDFSGTIPIGKYWMVPCDGNGSSGSPSFKYHFGEFGFQYSPRDSNYKPICTAYLNTPIQTPKDYFDIVEWTGSSAARNIQVGRSNYRWQPDLVWIKCVNNSVDHQLIDSARGATKTIRSNGSDIQDTWVDGLTSFNSDGFSLGDNVRVNVSPNTYIAWCWRAGGKPTADNVGGQNPTSGSRMTNGLVDTTQYASAGTYPIRMTTSTESGTSIIYYQGTGANTTIPHGLPREPDFVMWKALEDGYNWDVFHRWGEVTDSNSYQHTLQLNNNATARTVLHTDLTSTTIPVTHNFTGGSAAGKKMVAMCFTEIEGFSRFGQYRGGYQNTRAPYVHCGFKPKLVIVKRVDTSEGAGVAWRMMDRVRTPENGILSGLVAESNSGQNTGFNTIWFTASGFYWNTTDDGNVSNPGRYIFAAWAEVPQKFSTAV